MAGNITLSVSTISNGATSATVRVTMTYYGNGVSHNADASTISQKITLNGTTKTIGPHTFTTSTSAQTMGSADFSINKTHAAQSLTASGSMYTDVSLGTLYATATVSVSAKTSYSVSYNANGGSGAPGASTKWYGENLTLSTTKPTRSGYTFMGWGTSSSDTSVDYASGGTYSSNSGTTLYAIWKKDITLSYNANTGSGAPASETKTVYNATTSATFTIPSTIPTKQYYKFTGWKTGSTTYQPASQITISSNTTLTAQWVEDYITPQYGAVSAYRTNSAGTTNNGSGTYGKLTFTWTNGSLSGTTFNTTATAKYQEHGASSWTTITNGSSTANTFSAVFGGGALSADKQYDIQITLQDSGYPANTYVTYISTELFTIDVNATGTAIGLMMVAPDTDDGVIAPDYNLYINTSATSGADYDIVQALTSLGWEDIL